MSGELNLYWFVGSHMVPVLNNIGTDVSCVGVRVSLLGGLTEANVHARTTTSILA